MSYLSWKNEFWSPALHPLYLFPVKSDAPSLAHAVAPGLSTLGVMLPCSPLHSVIAHLFSGPLVATSGNLGDEPLCTDENQALDRLSSIADAFLVHDRVIENPVDDSVVRVIAQETRRLASRAWLCALGNPNFQRWLRPILALGPHLKNTVALGRGDRLYLSPHVGSLDTVASVDRWRREADALANLYGSGEVLTSACDLHPDYASSIHAPISIIRNQNSAPLCPCSLLSCRQWRQTARAGRGLGWERLWD